MVSYSGSDYHAAEYEVGKRDNASDYTAEIVYDYPASIEYMQDMTAGICSALTTWDGNNGEISRLKDKRDDKEYNVAKLADGNCWMLNNLRLGSESGSMNLTPADTNISSDWTLPQVDNNSSASFDTAYVYGPVTGDTGTGATDYGYLYNWCAATAGGTASGGANTCTASGTMPSDSTGDVCPANWRLPKGGDYDQAGNEFSNLVATLAGYPSNTDAGFTGAFDWGSTFAANIQPTGAFRSNYSGGWYGSFAGQEDNGTWWSSAHQNNKNAFALYVNASGDVDPDSVYPRNSGFAVRCMLK